MSEFRIDVLDASGSIVGNGPLVNALSVGTTRCLDRIGEATFSMPAADPRGALIQAGRQFDIYDRVDGYLGRFAYKSKTIKERGGISQLEVACHDQLRELTYYSVLFRRTYNAQSVETVVRSLAALAGWNAGVDTGIGTTTVTYEGESVLAAIDVLRDRWGKHYRLGTQSVIEFGAFGADSGVRLTNLRGQVQPDIADRTEIAVVDSISLVEEADEVVNRVIALGAGQGVSQLTMSSGTLGDYTVQVGANPDGSGFFFIEDAASVAMYGRRTRVLTLPNIRPISNSDTDYINASNALKLCAEAYMKRHLAPKVTYGVSVVGLRANIRPGDLVRLAYRGVVDGYSTIDVDQSFYVMDIQQERQAGGARKASLTISTTADRRTADTDIIADVINDVRALKVHVPITLAYAPVGPYTKRISPTSSASFTVRIGSEVAALNYAKLRFKTAPLKASATATATSGQLTSNNNVQQTSSSGGGSTPTTSSGGAATPTSSSTTHNHSLVVKADSSPGTAGVYIKVGESASNRLRANIGGDTAVDTFTDGAHTHDVTISNHTHDVTIGDHTHTVDAHNHTIDGHTHTLTYGLYEDTTYPQVISITVDGASVPGGTWAPANASVEHEIDITSLLTSGTLRMNHSIVFTCTGGRGEIEFECDMLCSIQAIAVS